MPRPLEFDIHNVVGVSIDGDGFIEITHDDEGEQGGAPVPVQHWHGLWSCPLEAPVDGSGSPDPTQSCASLTAYEGGARHCFALSNPAIIKGLPIGTPGETIVHNSFGAFSRYHADGSVTHSTTTDGGAATGQTVASRVMPTGFLEFAPWGRKSFDATGWRVNHAGGASIAVAYAAGGLPGLKSYVRMQSDMFVVDASACSIGPKDAQHMPVAKAQPLVTVLSAIGAALQAIQVAFTAITAGPTTGGGAPAAAACAAAVESAASQIGSALLAISTTTALG